MRALLVGAGGMGQAWAKNLAANEEVSLAGWIDVREGAAQSAAEKNGLAFDYYGSDLSLALKDVQPDFVVDVTPPDVHHDVTVTALGAGFPVLGEKPMANSMDEARAMVKASDDAGKLYMVSQSRRYISGFTGFKNLVTAELGRLGILDVDFYIGAHFGGFRDTMPHVLVLDMAIHTFDQARFLSGQDPVSVYSEEFNPSWSWYEGAASAIALFEMTNGLRFTYRGSWCAEGLHTSWDGDWRAVGSNGTALWAHNQTATAEVVAKPGGFHSEMRAITAEAVHDKDGIEGSLAEFLNALKTGATPNGECHDNIKSLAMVFGAITSAVRVERVQIAEILAG